MPVRLNDSARDGYPIVWDNVGDGEVTVFAEGEAGDVHNKRPQPNNGKAGLFYPDGFVGSSHIEVRDADGNVIDEGDIEIS